MLAVRRGSATGFGKAVAIAGGGRFGRECAAKCIEIMLGVPDEQETRGLYVGGIREIIEVLRLAVAHRIDLAARSRLLGGTIVGRQVKSYHRTALHRGM